MTHSNKGAPCPVHLFTSKTRVGGPSVLCLQTLLGGGWGGERLRSIPFLRNPPGRGEGRHFFLGRHFWGHGDSGHTTTKAEERRFRNRRTCRAVKPKPLCVLESQLLIHGVSRAPSPLRVCAGLGVFLCKQGWALSCWGSIPSPGLALAHAGTYPPHYSPSHSCLRWTCY